jgi:uncharacterized protein YndB with AHSA1/START domain
LSTTTNLDHFKPAAVYTIYIAATPEKVWQALTIPQEIRCIFSGRPERLQASSSTWLRIDHRCVNGARYHIAA